jgi:hypothetical protein
MSLVNAYLIYKENHDTSRMTMLQLGALYENLKPSPRERSTSQTKSSLADHKLKETQESDRDVRRRCTGYYAKIREQKSKEKCVFSSLSFENGADPTRGTHRRENVNIFSK